MNRSTLNRRQLAPRPNDGGKAQKSDPGTALFAADGTGVFAADKSGIAGG